MLLDLPLEIFGHVINFLSMRDAAELAACSRDLRHGVWAQREGLHFTAQNIAPLTELFTKVMVPVVRIVYLQHCFFPEEFGVPTFLGQVTDFTWHACNPHLTGSGLRCGCPTGHMHHCLAALSTSKLASLVLDNSTYVCSRVAAACETLFWNFAKQPMVRIQRLAVRDVFHFMDALGNRKFGAQLFDALRDHWTMPNLKTFECDECECPVAEPVYANRSIETELDRSIHAEFGTDASCINFHVLGPVLRRCDPALLERVILRPGSFGAYCDFGCIEGPGRKLTPSQAVSAFERIFGQDYGKFWVPVSRYVTDYPYTCMCRSLSRFLESDGTDHPDADLHSVGKCTAMTLREINKARDEAEAVECMAVDRVFE